ncbi:MAG: class I SAM-dependent methyltransferase [Methylobacteriaceae bacterium]|nr:class I SAM-dependent methyltransferase [Methylobacteriaceae bacterium]
MTPLEILIREMIATEGPMPVSRYMALALGHPTHGYYVTRDPLGAAGDFTTAPEISQMFGELLGLWAAETWTRMGRPDPVRLVELGPGRGTLMADAIRAARALPAFRDALRLHLVETSPVLAEAQRARLAPSGRPAAWHPQLDEVPEGPAIILANEFLDALPIRQLVRTERGWHERLVGLGENRLAFGLASEPSSGMPSGGQPGDVLEIGAAAAEVARTLAARFARHPGAALLIDYGHARSGFGDTLQAVRRHAATDPLAEPGEADLTAHVDFAAFLRAGEAAGAVPHGPVRQGDFLLALGITARAERLGRGASPDAGANVRTALARLTGSGPGEMGALFKAAALSSPDLPDLPGLPRAATTGKDAP